MEDTDASFHTFLPRHNVINASIYMIVIRNLHHTTLIHDTSAVFSEVGHLVKQEHNLI